MRGSLCVRACVCVAGRCFSCHAVTDGSRCPSSWCVCKRESERKRESDREFVCFFLCICIIAVLLLRAQEDSLARLVGSLKL